jgi:hypothetical protein
VHVCGEGGGRLTLALVVPACFCSGNKLVLKAFHPQPFLPIRCGPSHTGAGIHLQDSRCRSDGGASWALLLDATTCCLPPLVKSPPNCVYLISSMYSTRYELCITVRPHRSRLPTQGPRFRRLRQSHPELGGRVVGAREVQLPLTPLTLLAPQHEPLHPHTHTPSPARIRLIAMFRSYVHFLSVRCMCCMCCS